MEKGLEDEKQQDEIIKDMMFNKHQQRGNINFFAHQDSIELHSQHVQHNINKLIEQELEELKKSNIESIIGNIECEDKKELIENELKNNCKTDNKSTMEKRKSSILRNQWVMNSVRKSIQPNENEDDIDNNNNKKYKGSIQSIESEDEEQLLLTGYLNKKTPGILNRWKKYYCTLNDEKLCLYEIKQIGKDQLDYILKLVISFRHLICTLEKQEKKQQIIINIKNQNKSFKLKECQDSKVKLEEWFKQINDVINENKQMYEKKQIKPQKATLYLKNNMITEQEFENKASTGDILLFKTNNLNAKLQRATTSSDYDHVGIVIKLKDNILRVFDAQIDDGVSISEWRQFIAVNDLFDKVVLRKLNHPKLRDVLPDFYQFVLSSIGQKYNISLGKLMKKRSSVINDASRENGYFCSELVAKAYKHIGVINPHKSSCQYWPRTFSEGYEDQLKMYEGMSLGKEQSILLNRHIFHESQLEQDNQQQQQ